MSVGNIPNESESLELLQGMMGESFDADVARRVLKKFGGDLNQAAAAIIEGETGESAISSWPTNSISQANYNSQASGSSSGALNAPQRTNTPCPPEEGKKEKEVIDLTGDYDPELHQALALSLESESQSQAVFGPSTRAPDPNWAVVPSNVPAGTTITDAQTQEEQSLSRAIEASLSTSFLEDKFEELPLDDRILQPDHPVALRTGITEFYFTTLVIHALYHVPQVRERLAQWRYEAADDTESVAAYMCYIFTFMDLTITSDITIDDSLRAILHFYTGKRANSASESPGDLSNEIYTYVVRDIEEKVQEVRSMLSGQWDRLFHLRYAPTNQPLLAEDVSSNALGLDTPLPISSPDIACVKVDVRGSEEGNDLLSCLSSQLGLDGKDDAANIPGLIMHPQSLVAPSEVVAFHLIRQSQGSQSQVAGSASHPFRYPKHVYLDQFLRECVALADEKRALRKEMQNQIKELTDKKNDLISFKGKDTLKSLTSAVYYFENVASREGTPTRGEEVKSAAMDLRKILTQVENEVQALDTQISRLRTLSEKVFDDPALRNYRYDLRAVLVHDGLFGRNHIYSFVHHNGKWWKTQDYSVVEVSEELVLTDNTGLHLGAGPYMLIYSRATQEHDVKSDWPITFKDMCEAENQHFIDALGIVAPEKGARLRKSYASVNSHPSPRTRKLSSDTSIESTSTIRGPSRSMSIISVSDDEASESLESEGQSTQGMQIE